MGDPNGNRLAKINGNIVCHIYDIVAPDKTVIAKVHLKRATVRDEYCMEIVKLDFNPLLVLRYAVAMEHVEREDGDGVSKEVIIITRLLGH